MSKKRKIIYSILVAIPLLVFAYVVISIFDNAHRWAFVAAAGSGDNQLVRRFLREGMHPDTASHFPTGRPLSSAAWSGHYDTVIILLDAGANPDFGLRYAIKANRIAVVRVLLARGANPNLVENHNMSPCPPLCLAKNEDYNNPEIIALLKAAGAK